jgi:hypothetical protein
MFKFLQLFGLSEGQNSPGVHRQLCSVKMDRVAFMEDLSWLTHKSGAVMFLILQKHRRPVTQIVIDLQCSHAEAMLFLAVQKALISKLLLHFQVFEVVVYVS